MKKETQKIILTKKGEISKHVTNAIGHCRFEDGKIFTGYYSGSGRYASRHSASETIKQILSAQGYGYKFFNDGGAPLEYIKCSKIATKFILSLKNL